MANDAFNPTVTPTQDPTQNPTPTTPQVMPPANGINVRAPLTQVNPYISDVTRTAQAGLGMLDINPSARQYNADNRWMGPVVMTDYNYGTRTAGQGATMTGFEMVMWDSIQNVDPLIQKKLVAKPRFWHDRIPRGQFQLHDGAVHQSRFFRGGLDKFAGLSEWEAIDPVPSVTNDPCSFPKHDYVETAYDQIAWSGMRSAFGSPRICANAFRYIKDAAQQVGLYLDQGMERGIQMQEVFNRDTYLSKSTDFGRSFVMSCEYRGMYNSPRYFYDPFVKFAATGSSATKTAQASLVTGPDGKPKAFAVINADVEIEPLNFKGMMDRVHEELKLRCPDAAISSDAGEPVFGLMCNAEDIDNAIVGDEKLYREWLEAKPQALIDKYNLSPRLFQRWAIVSDKNQLRFKIHRYISKSNWTSQECAKYGGVGSELVGKSAVYIALAVDPFVPDPYRRGINGGPIPMENIEYIDAELAIAPVFMNDVVTNLFETQGTVQLGHETHFGAFPALNGSWGWVPTPPTAEEPFGQSGKFYGMFLIHQRPETHIYDTISFMYRRCKESIRAKCPIEVTRVNPDAESTTYTVSAGKFTFAAATVGLGDTFDMVLGKGSGVLHIGAKHTLSIGGKTVNTVVVDVTSAPYITVAALSALDAGTVTAIKNATADGTFEKTGE